MAGMKRGREVEDDANHHPTDEADNGQDGHNEPTSAVGTPWAAEGRPAKRAKLQSAAAPIMATTLPPHPPGTDYLSPLSDELLVRILGYLSMPSLLAMAPVSRRFHRLADDSHLWKALYYGRFVLPRALRIPGFRGRSLAGLTSASTAAVRQDGGDAKNSKSSGGSGGAIDWKRQYKLRHNWARGICAVEELRLGGGGAADDGSIYSLDEGDNEDESGDGRARMLVKVVDGIAVTADRRRGLRVWELKSRSMVVGARLVGRTSKSWTTGEDAVPRVHSHGAETKEEQDDTMPAVPTSLALEVAANGGLDIAVGFLDGGFDVWRLDLEKELLVRRFTHPASSSGALMGIAYSHPFLLTATDSVLISLYAFGGAQSSTSSSAQPLRSPTLLTSLRSHTSRPPLALSIRRLPSLTVASIAYTFPTRQGWSIGIQDLHVKRGDADGGLPKVVTSRLAYSLPISGSSIRRPPPPPMRRRPRQRRTRPHGQMATVVHSSPLAARDAGTPYPARRFSSPPAVEREDGEEEDDDDEEREEEESGRGSREQQDAFLEDAGGPTTLCYTHPYLLATLPDNTLVLHLCTSTGDRLALSPGIRLWGHTSGISDAEITARGKAVSVSVRGDEMRVWELEGRPAAERGRSVSVSIRSGSGGEAVVNDDDDGGGGGGGGITDPSSSSYDDWQARRNWVGFDDEMVIVLKEARAGRESLLVYDFT